MCFSCYTHLYGLMLLCRMMLVQSLTLEGCFYIHSLMGECFSELQLNPEDFSLDLVPVEDFACEGATLERPVCISSNLRYISEATGGQIFNETK